MLSKIKIRWTRAGAEEVTFIPKTSYRRKSWMTESKEPKDVLGINRIGWTRRLKDVGQYAIIHTQLGNSRLDFQIPNNSRHLRRPRENNWKNERGNREGHTLDSRSEVQPVFVLKRSVGGSEERRERCSCACSLGNSKSP